MKLHVKIFKWMRYTGPLFSALRIFGAAERHCSRLDVILRALDAVAFFSRSRPLLFTCLSSSLGFPHDFLLFMRRTGILVGGTFRRKRTVDYARRIKRGSSSNCRHAAEN